MSSIQNHGFIAQLVDQEGKVFSRVFGYSDYGSREHREFGKTGKIIPARLPLTAMVWLRELVDHCDQRGFEIQVISSPSTILEDLRGRRCYSNEWVGGSAFPEERMLGPLGRMDLIDPSARIAREGVGFREGMALRDAA